MPGPPVARIRRTSGALISSWHPARAGMVRQLTAPLGAPAASAARATSSAAWRVQETALGWGEKMMAQPAFRAMMAL